MEFGCRLVHVSQKDVACHFHRRQQRILLPVRTWVEYRRPCLVFKQVHWYRMEEVRIRIVVVLGRHLCPGCIIVMESIIIINSLGVSVVIIITIIYKCQEVRNCQCLLVRMVSNINVYPTPLLAFEDCI